MKKREEMRINSIVIHEVIKEANTTTAEVYLSEELLDIENPHINKIVTSLEDSFRKKTLKRAKFSEGGFQEEVDDFTNYDLVEVSKTLTRKLKDNIQGISPSKGGYLIFTEFENNHNFLGVFLVRNTDGTKLIQSGTSWNLNSTQYLNVEHFAMGAQINLTILTSASPDRYISLVRGNTDISSYFENWIGIDDSKQENKDAEALYEISNLVDLPEDITNRDEFKKKIHDYANTRPSKVVNLRELSQFLYEDENILSNYCTNNNIDIDGEFKLSGKNLNRFYKVAVKADNIELSAPRSSFNPNMIRVANGQVIINSSSLAEEIQNSLNNN